jgi:hypothetical protein
MKIRVWYEYYTVDEALSNRTCELLKRYGVSVCLAFPHGSMDPAHARLLRTWHEHGVECALWPLLPDAQGYWPNERNADVFFDYVREIFDWAQNSGFPLPWLAVDLEPPLYMMESIKQARPVARIGALRRLAGENRDLGRFYGASRRFEQMNEFLHERGCKSLVPIPSHVISDLVSGSTALQDLLETPVSTVNWDMVTAMIYTSMITGYSRGLIRPRDARWYLYAAMRDLKEKLWDRAGVSVGVTWTGKMGDEPYYASPQELLPDIQAAKAALIDDITIYNLEGILRSKQPEAWFEMLLEAEPLAPPRSHAVDAVRALGGLLSKVL